jgi:erythromycin esterase-like protein
LWRNADTLDLVGWLRAFNERIADPRDHVGFYGLDLYSLHASMNTVLAYLARRDPGAARRARDRYACLDEIGPDPRLYGYRIALGVSPDCGDEVVAELRELLAHRAEVMRRDGMIADDARFEAEQNARVVASAEAYYRAMYEGRTSTWNLRDTHMIDTLDALDAHLARDGRTTKIVVWAHNSHVGDSRALVHRLDREEITLGRLCRDRHPDETVLIGFTTTHGTVTAASSWNGDAERKQLRPALSSSYEALFHHTAVPRFVLLLDDLGEAAGALHEPRLERSIGVVYRPDTERASHYYAVRLTDQLDAVVHIDETRAVEPLERGAMWERGEVPVTYPTGL